MTLAWKGIKTVDNGTGWLVAEYNQRRRLREIGVTQDISKLDAFRAEAFLIISDQISELERQDQKKREANSKSGSRRR